MSRAVRRLKDALRPARNVLAALCGFGYDFSRYVRYAGWRGRRDRRKKDYKAVKAYHRLEKSLSFRQRRQGSGWDAAGDLVRLLSRGGFDAAALGYHETVGIKVLRDFVAAAPAEAPRREVSEFLRRAALWPAEGGVLELSAEALRAGRLDDPERFFLSRHSVRDFRPEPVPQALLERAVRLAMKAPSVCNRQAWHVYQLDRRESIDRALALQNGNRGFGHEVPCLLIVTADLRAFDSHGERFQHWIDGGMFAMSLVLALHALGLASCCLNWSRGPLDDLALRRAVAIDGAHTVIMLMAVGYASERLKVCYSARRPLASILTHLD
ncbi:nitroreductase family protein [Frateuria defendens]|uniref:nitroreductase family protein n=1 Tax=Frateuria defendens TaxID=2219559 RepID=UPI0007DBFE33|nr:nitroreductase family protein [Frateuria defendens]